MQRLPRAAQLDVLRPLHQAQWLDPGLHPPPCAPRHGPVHRALPACEPAGARRAGHAEGAHRALQLPRPGIGAGKAEPLFERERRTT
jgi:hypothetical protein